jgi:hypothetical protein
VHWKSIAGHALVILGVGVLAGFLEPQPDSAEPRALFLAYFGTQALLLAAYTAVFAHLAHRVPRLRLVHALSAALLGEGIAFALLALIPYELPATPWLLAAIEYAVLAAALLAGTAIGTSIRNRRIAHGSTVANA